MISLSVNGKEYGGWKSARVTRGIEAVAGSFDLSVSERWANQNSPWAIVEEDECKINLHDSVVLTGYVDARRIAISADDHSLTVAGRDRTGDLVDCSAVLDKWEFRNVQLKALVEKVCAPFGIPVTLQSGITIPAIAKVSIDPGDSAFDVIDRVCRIAGVLPVADGVGGLLLTRVGTDRATTALVEGENILSATADFDASGRFRHYFVLGQHRGTDDVSGASAASIKGFAEDETVSRVARSLVVRPEGNVNQAQAKTRAQWEMKVRAGRAGAVSVTVVGWTQGNGTLWPINALVPVKSTSLGIDGDLLITQAVYAVDDSSGYTTELSLMRADAFLPEPVVTESKALGGWAELRGGA